MRKVGKEREDREKRQSKELDIGFPTNVRDISRIGSQDPTIHNRFRYGWRKPDTENDDDDDKRACQQPVQENEYSSVPSTVSYQYRLRMPRHKAPDPPNPIPPPKDYRSPPTPPADLAPSSTKDPKVAHLQRADKKHRRAQRRTNLPPSPSLEPSLASKTSLLDQSTLSTSPNQNASQLLSPNVDRPSSVSVVSAPVIEDNSKTSQQTRRNDIHIHKKLFDELKEKRLLSHPSTRPASLQSTIPKLSEASGSAKKTPMPTKLLDDRSPTAENYVKRPTRPQAGYLSSVQVAGPAAIGENSSLTTQKDLPLCKVVRDLQMAYFQQGTANFTKQAPHLKNLADHYYRSYAESQRWSDSLKAFTLYIAAAVDNKASPYNPPSKEAWNAVKQCLGDSIVIDYREFCSKANSLHKTLQDIRCKLKNEVDRPDKTLQDVDEMKNVTLESNNSMRKFLETVICESLDCMKHPLPCKFSAIGIGSLGRGEATPYSDVEYIFLVQDSDNQKYFEKLAVMSYFLIGALKETNLKRVGVKELEGWFVDKRRCGFQIDGITTSSGNIPTGSEFRPNHFIVTPQELIQRYETVLNNPKPEASLRGDLTAMMTFTTLIHTTQSEETLLSWFKKEKESLDTNRNGSREKCNIEMFKNDLRKFIFCAEYDFYSSGFLLDVKRLVYRFPSILLLDLAVITNDNKEDSWKTLDHWGSSNNTDGMFTTELFTLLAAACFSRLRCYLFMDSSFSEIQMESPLSPDKSFIRDGSQRHILFSHRPVTWTIARDEFFQIAKASVILQQHFISHESTLNSKLMKHLVQMPVTQCTSATGLAHFFCSEWPVVAATLQGGFQTGQYLQENSCSSASLLVSANALAFSSLQCRMYRKSIDQYFGICDAIRQSGDNKLILSLYCGIANCYLELGESAKAYQAYESALEVCEVSSGEEKSMLSSSQDWEDFSMYKGMTLFHFGLLHARTGSDIKKALTLMFRAVKYFILAASVNGKDISILENFCSLPYLERLSFISHPTRALGHCVFCIAELFETIGHGKLAKEYYDKARTLGLMMVVDQQQEGLTKVAVLNELGSRFKIRKYVDGAKQLLKQQAVNDSSRQLGCDIMRTEGDFLMSTQPHTLLTDQNRSKTELEMEVDSFIDGLPDGDNRETDHDEIMDLSMQTSNNNSEELTVNAWFRDTKAAIEDLYKDQTHVDLAKVHKIRGDVAKSMNHISQAISFYQEAKNNYKMNGCKVQQATVGQLEADLHKEAHDNESAETCLEDSQNLLESAHRGLPGCSHLQLAEVKLARAVNLKACKRDHMGFEVNTLEKEAKDITQNAEMMKKRAAQAVEDGDTADRTSKSLDSLMAKLRLNVMDVEPAKYPELEKQLMKDINKMKQYTCK